MKTLKFSKALIDLILSGQKLATWRINDEKNIVTGDMLSLCGNDGKEFAKATVTSVKETAFGQLSDEDKESHERFSSDEEMYKTYSKYYKTNIVPETVVKIIKFKLLNLNPVEGLLILDKPSGITSRAVVDEVKKILSVKTAGHVGTLDPNATGVLPILLGRATRVAPALERLDKTYVATVHFHQDIVEAELKEVLKKFIGTIRQMPPVKSAVVRRERERKVYSIDILCKDGKDVRVRIVCEAGTYIRKLASDVGLLVGGAHLKELRRTRAGHFDEKQAHTIEELRNAVGANSLPRADNDANSALMRIILPVERAVSHLPKVVAKDSSIAKVMNGSPLFAADISRIDDFDDGVLVAIVSMKGELLALGKRKGKAIRIDRVVKA